MDTEPLDTTSRRGAARDDTVRDETVRDERVRGAGSKDPRGEVHRPGAAMRRPGDRPSLLNGSLMATIALGVTGGLLLLHLTEAMLARVQNLLVAVLVSMFLSFAMEPAAQWLARRGMRRGMATTLVFLGAGLLFIGFAAAMVPLVVSQVRTLVENGPSLLLGLADRARDLPGGVGDGIANFLDRRALPEFDSTALIGRVGGGLLGFGTTLLGGVLQMLTILLLTFYLVADGPRLRRSISSRVSARRQADVLAIWELAIEKTGGYVYSRLLIAVASAAFHATAFEIIGLPYAVALGMWVGVVSSLIPVVGTYLAGALPIVVALAYHPISAVWAVAAVIVYQQLENYLVAPRVTATTMALHPAIAFLSVLAGGALLGATGALLALPVAAIIGGLLSAAGERHEIMAHELLEETGIQVTR